MKTKSILTIHLIALLSLSIIYSCSEHKSKDHDKEKEEKKEKKLEKEKDINPDETNSEATQFIATGCKPSLWEHVYDPTRLKIIDSCIAVTGVIQQSGADDDGDEHFLLKLDAGQEGLVNKKNKAEKNGNLVIEVVCANTITLPKAKGACRGYINNIVIPPMETHIKVTGSYVIDTHNGWAEIHPVTKIEVIK